MSQVSDVWYVRFPDGQIMRAPSTEAVRYHIDRGRIPLSSRVRRSTDEEWAALEWTVEFADLVTAVAARPKPEPARAERGRGGREPAGEAPWGQGPPATGWASFREDRLQLRTVGVRGMFEEMLSALDSTLARVKLRVAGLTGLLGAVVLVVAGLFAPQLEEPGPVLVWAGAALALLLLGAACTALLTQLTFTELSHARSPRWEDAKVQFGRNLTRLALSFLVVLGGLWLAIWVLSQVPGWLPDDWTGPGRDVVAGAATVLMLVLLVLVGPVLLFALLLGPVVVIEEPPAGKVLGLWWRFLGEHFTRVFVYEGLAATLAVVASLPLVLPVLAAVGLMPTRAASVGLVVPVTLTVLAGLAITPLIAYLVVANLFIYLNLRYETAPRR